YILKGNNLFTEHYSAIQADVPDETDPSTKLNTRLLDALKTADRIFIAGEALSHCVANTVIDIADNLGEANVKKFILLRNAASSVTGCEVMGESFIRRMAKRGMRLMTTEEVHKSET
ncbi:MAG TPA: hypothetical protein VNT26_21635, partial [Candidatus Sulfotelmatobacter sp.]|nr:hypothetical protein [Candidatus Sulfotelmatobacter sp.]